MVVPVSGIIQLATPTPHADRYTYLPGIGLAIAAAWAVADWSIGWKPQRVVLRGLMIAVVGTLTVWGHRQVSYWKDNESLWSRALACTSDNYVAFNNRGSGLIQLGKLEEAISQYHKALAIKPNEANTLNNLGNAMAIKGDDDAAIALYKKALESQPDYNAAANLGNAFLRRRRLDEAVAQYREALKFRSDNPETLSNLGKALLLLGDFDSALACFEKTGVLSPDPFTKWESLGNAFLQMEDWEPAIACYQQAIRIKPRSADIHAELGTAFFRNGNTKAAMDSLQQALDIEPNQVPIQNNLALLLATTPETALRDGARAVALATKANQLSGGANPSVLSTLAAAYAEEKNFELATATARRALELAVAQKQDALAASLQNELKRYEASAPPQDAPR